MSRAPDLVEAVPLSLQDLLPKWAHFCLYTEKFITHELGLDLSGKHLIVGLSGGVDSTALLLVLRYLSVRNDFRVTAAHLNHSLRPEAVEDEAWAQQVCQSLDIPFLSTTVDVAAIAHSDSIGIEEAGRNARYAFLRDVMKENDADFIALGHHLDDLSEDVLMRFIRGTGWPGLSGMPGYDPERMLVRPFLMLPKSTLIAFVRYTGLSWREDATNDDPTWTRNRVRNTLLPLILEENPNFKDAIGRLWKIGRIESDFWDQSTTATSDTLDNSLLEASHKALRLRMYKKALDALGQGQALAHTLFKLDEAWVEKRLGSIFQFPGDKTATITAKGVVFSLKH